MGNPEKNECEKILYNTGLFDDLTVQDAYTIIALYAAQLDPEDCREDVNRIMVLFNDDPLFEEKSSDTLTRINKFTNSMEEVNSLNVVETAAKVLTPELRQKAFMLAAQVSKSVQGSQIEAVKILESLAPKLSMDSKIVNQTIASVIKNFLDEIKDKGVLALAQMSEERQLVITRWAQGIFDWYISVLETYPTKIKNIAKLPFSKQDIKMAIKILLTAYFIKGEKEMVNKLKDRYISTGAFQDIAPDDQEKFIKEISNIEQELESAYSSVYPEYHKYMELIIAEQNALLADVNSFIHDLKQLRR